MQKLYDIKNSMGHLTGLASRLFNNLLASRFHAAGIDMTAEQWGAIVILMNMEPLSQGQLGEQLYLDKSSVSRLTTGLEKRGWVMRSKDPDDNRKKVLIVTPSARDLVERCSDIARSVLHDAEQGLQADAVAAQKATLTQIISNLRGAAP